MVELRTPLRDQRRTTIAALLSAIATTALGIHYSGNTGPGAFDKAAAGTIDDLLGRQQELLRFLVQPTQPYVLLPAIGVLALVCALNRQWPAALLALFGPGVAVAANTWLLKPVFDRYNGGALAYPSGHTVSLVSVLVVLAILARPGPATWIVLAIGAVLVLAAGTGMVGLDYHYPTDVIGGVFFAITAVLVVAIAVDRRPG